MGQTIDLEQKKRHLLRRFGFGVTPRDLEALGPLSLEASIERCLRTDAPDTTPLFSFFYRDKEEADPNSWRTRGWWLSEMCLSPTPLREKLALFWHGHFAASDGKVEHGPMMADYLIALRQEPAGRFRDILGRVLKTPAFLKMLDVYRLRRGQPNENFGRELLELYTLGIGNYTEKDIQETARAFTGWSYEDIFWSMGENNTKRLDQLRREGIPCASFALLTAYRDATPKTILGKKGDFDGDAVLDLLAVHPQTAKFLCSKLWTYFGSNQPAPKAIDRMAKRFLASQGSLRDTLHEMAQCPEFWAESCVGQRIKSPAEFAVGYVRSLGMERAFAEKIKTDAGKSVDAHTFEVFAGMGWHLEQMGQSLLWPPTVKGWDEGEAWITSNNMIRRRGFPGIDPWVKTTKDGKDKWTAGPALMELAAWVQAKAPADAEAYASLICARMDVRLAPEGRQALADFFTKANGKEALKNQEWLAGVLSGTLDLLRLSPAYQLC